MSLLDDVSIVVTPNGYKAGELYAVIPVPTEGSEKIINGSNTIAGADWNANSNWDKTVTGLFSCDGSTNNDINQGINLPTVNLRYIISFEILSINSGGIFVANYGGVVGTNRTSVGVYSEIITAANSTERIRVRPNASGTIGSVTGISVKEYTAADMDVTRATDATRVDENGLIEDVLSNVPRIDYTGGGCPHILAEPMRTNLIPYSEDFSQYTNSDTTDTANTVTSPDGTVNGTTLTASGSGSLNHIITSPTYTIASGEITSSIFAKKGTVNYIRLRLNGTTGGERAWYNLNNGTIDGEDVSSSAKIEDYGNGWYRCSLTSSSNIASGSGKSLQIFIQDSGGSQTAWTANGTENIYIWGTQTEQGSYATSYIPNFGTAAGVTRNQDIFTRDGIGSLINSTEGVLFVEMAALANDGTYRTLSISDGTTANRVAIRYKSSVNEMQVFVVALGATQVILTKTGLTITDFNKVAIKWKLNDFSFWIGGVEIDTDLSGSVPVGINSLNFNSGANTNPFYGKVKQLQVYDTALTDTQLAALTS